jgi:hypothetical protein
MKPSRTTLKYEITVNRAERPKEPRGNAGAGRELQRRDPAAGGGAMTRIVALALALVMTAPAAEAADQGHAHRHHAVVILLGKTSPPHRRPQRYDHHPLHGARPQFYARGEAGDPVI